MRSALATQRDLAALAREFGGLIWGRWLVAPLIVAAIGIGNAAYQSGNLSGAAVGLTAFMPDRFASAVLSLSAVAVILILGNRYHWLERVLVALVALMAFLFFGLAIILAPEILSLSADRLAPRFRSEDSLLVLALIGTTIVPYNLFLHATAARRRWQDTRCQRHCGKRGGNHSSLFQLVRRSRWRSWQSPLCCWNRHRINRCSMP
ncbi:MAG: hypothetical protein CM15mP74_33070 [Halieaceae bacterium]|nr:MAG: hypothetical protein CM15mP74_33070 [Halieaceae bacterium]